MKLAPILAVALGLLAGCATTRSGEASPTERTPAEAALAARRAEEAEVSRAMTELADADRKGDVAALRARYTASAQADALDAKARFMALWALPHGDDTWAELKALSQERKDAPLPVIGQALIYVEWGVLDQVERTLAVAERLDPGSLFLPLTRGLAAEAAERYLPAGEAYQAVLALDPANVEAHDGLARIARRAGRGSEARTHAEAALAARPEHAPALAILAALAVEAGDQQGAAGLHYRLVAASPRDRAARVALAKLLKEKGDASASRDQWRAAIALREDAEALVALAEVSRLCGDVEAEAQALERLSQIDPGSAEWRRIAEIRLTANDLDGAEKALRRALAREPKHAGTALSLGRVLVRTGKVQEALEQLRNAGPDGAAERAELEQRLGIERAGLREVAATQRAVGALIDKVYRGRLKESPRLSGQLTVRVTVDSAGGATLVEVLEDSVHDDDVRACAYWNLRDAIYPSSKPGRYSFSFALRPGR
jgi:tetratricopeptide (TPR) repeat protein